MTTNALAELDVDDAKIAKRAQYEAFEFDLVAPGLLRVTNGSYGDDEKADHSYLVNIEGGVPVACECPSDEYSDGACKHRVGVAIREPVLAAGTASRDGQVATDGGIVVADDEGEVLEDSNEGDECKCHLLPGDYPCAHCYTEEGAEWPDDTDAESKEVRG